jgi:HlyD family secretion protein
MPSSIYVAPGARCGPIAALVVTSFVLAGCSHKGGTPATEPRPVLTVEMVSPTRQDIPRSIAASGAIAAWQDIAVGAEVSGLRVRSVEVDVGDRVRRGQVLARLDSNTLAAEVRQAEAFVAETRASAREAHANAERARALAGSALSARDVDQLITASATADARVANAVAQLDNAKQRLAFTTIVATDDGIVSARNVTPGQVVAAGADLFHIIRQARIEWRAEVPERDYTEVRPGMTVEVRPIAGAKVTGRVRAVSPGLDPATRRGMVYADVPLRPDLRPGMFVNGTLALGNSPGLVVPVTAVTTHDGAHYVFVIGADHRVRETKVELGRALGDRIELVGGPSQNARLVRSGTAFLRDGDLVAIAPDAAK